MKEIKLCKSVHFSVIQLPGLRAACELPHHLGLDSDTSCRGSGKGATVSPKLHTSRSWQKSRKEAVNQSSKDIAYGSGGNEPEPKTWRDSAVIFQFLEQHCCLWCAGHTLYNVPGWEGSLPRGQAVCFCTELRLSHPKGSLVMYLAVGCWGCSCLRGLSLWNPHRDTGVCQCWSGIIGDEITNGLTF